MGVLATELAALARMTGQTPARLLRDEHLAENLTVMRVARRERAKQVEWVMANATGEGAFETAVMGLLKIMCGG